MYKLHIPRFLLMFGIVGVFIYATVIALGSFALFGCWCDPSTWIIKHDTPPPREPVSTDGPAAKSANPGN